MGLEEAAGTRSCSVLWSRSQTTWAWTENASRLSRAVWRRSGGAVLRRGQAARVVRTGNPGQCFYELVAVPLLALVFMRQSTKAFGRISCVFPS